VVAEAIGLVSIYSMKDIAKFIVFGGLFTIPFLVLSVQNDMFFPYITGKNFGFRIITEIIFAAWIILACFDPAYRPKKSWILGSFSVLIVIMFFANWFGESRIAGFWSNFERMEGYMALIHTWMYFIVAASTLTTEKLWNRFIATNIAVAGIVSFIAFGQVAGFVDHRYDGFRADATLGNATYMAIYMLFTSFAALLLASRVRSQSWRYALICASLLFMFMIVQTATRGTTLALILGLFVSTLYIGVLSAQYRKFALGTLGALAVLVIGFILARDSAFIQNNPTLQRVANITLSEGSIRFTVWEMAYEGFKERPILGWGQSGFSPVFNKNYDPSLYMAESWYDRVHNIVFDWLIAGGILGTVAYFGMFFVTLYYLVRPQLRSLFRMVMKSGSPEDARAHEGDNQAFTVVERGILVGLLIGYLFHNMFVFDNIVSYIYYGGILAFIHSRIGTPWMVVSTKKIDTRITEQVVTPVVLVACALVVYFVNIPGIQAAGDIIDAFRASSPEVTMAAFDRALSRNSFGDQEIREQMTRKVQEIIFNTELPQEFKNSVIEKVEKELLAQIEEKPNDARAHVFIAAFYRSLGTADALEKAEVQLARARELSPKKQQIIFEQGLTQLQKQNYESGHTFFKEAYELDTSYIDARVFYALGGVTTGRYGVVDEVIVTEDQKRAFYTNDLVLQMIYNVKQYPLMIAIFEYRITENPQDQQLRANLAFVLNESGDTEGAIAVLKKASEDIPEFKTQADQFISDITKPDAVRVNQ